MLLGAAEALAALSRQKHAVSMTAADIESLRQRTMALEQQQQASAELLKQLADHATAITSAAHEVRAEVQQAFVLSIVAVVLAIAAVLVAWFT